MQEEGVIRLRALDKPLHCLDDVVLAGICQRAWRLVICQDDHILPTVAVVLDQEGRQVLRVVDTSAQLALLAKVVDADQQGPAAAGTVGILEGVFLGRTMAELLGARRDRVDFPLVILGIAIAV